MYHEEFDELVFMETSYINLGEYNNFQQEKQEDEDNKEETLFI